MNKPNVQPDPTDSVLYLNGHVSQPANAIFFVTQEQAQALRADLESAGTVPSNTKILDVSYAAGPVVYGPEDQAVGRAILGLQWHEVVQDGDGGQHQELREVFAGLLYWRWRELPAGKWRNLGDGNIGRW